MVTSVITGIRKEEHVATVASVLQKEVQLTGWNIEALGDV